VKYKTSTLNVKVSVVHFFIEKRKRMEKKSVRNLAGTMFVIEFFGMSI